MFSFNNAVYSLLSYLKNKKKKKEEEEEERKKKKRKKKKKEKRLVSDITIPPARVSQFKFLKNVIYYHETLQCNIGVSSAGLCRRRTTKCCTQ